MKKKKSGRSKKVKRITRRKKTLKPKKKTVKKQIWSKPFEFSEDDMMNPGRSLFPYDHEDV